MLRLIVLGREVSLFKEESVKLVSKIKDLKDISKVFDDFSYEFKVPANGSNNDLFEHIPDGTVIGGADYNDFHNKQPAIVEIDGIDYRYGYIKYVRAVRIKGVLSHHTIKFTGGLLNITTGLGNSLVSELGLSHLNHYTNTSTVVQGLNHSSNLLGGKVIYPLMNNSSSEWTLEKLSNGTIEPTDLSPAISAKEIMDAIAAKVGVTFTYDASLTALDELYLWCNKKLEDDVNVTEPIKTPIPLKTINTRTKYTKALDQYDGIIALQTEIKESDIIGVTITVTPNLAEEYTVHLYESVWVTQFTPAGFQQTHTGTQTFTFTFGRGEITGNYIRFLIESQENITIDVELTMDVVGFSETYIHASDTAIAVAQYTNNISYRIPKIKSIDFLRGMMKLFNLIPVADPTNSTGVIFYSYQGWREAFNNVVDITDYVDIEAITIDVPSTPKEISFQYKEPTTAPAEVFRSIEGRFYGDLIDNNTKGEGKEFKVEVPFENMVWDKLPGSETLVGKAYKTGTNNQELDGVFDKLFLMYRDITGAPCDIQINGASKITTYKLCNSYSADQRDSLNFGYETDQFTRTRAVSSIYLNSYADFTEHLLNPTTRHYKLKAFIPPAVLSQIHLASTLVIGDMGYSISTMSSDLSKGLTEFELISRFNAAIKPAPIVDTEAPIIGVLSVEYNNAPSIPVNLVPSDVTGTEFTLSWDASTTTTSIKEYEVFQNGISYGTTATNSIDITGLTLGSYNKWSVEAIDIEDQRSSRSIEFGVQMFNSEGVVGADAYTVILSNEAHTLPTTNAGVVTYTGSGTNVRVFAGSNELVGVSGVPTANQYRVTIVSDTNITAGSITHGQPTIIGQHTNMTQSNAEVTYSIDVEGLFTLEKVQSFAKSNQGNDGSDGNDGAPGQDGEDGQPGLDGSASFSISLNSDRYVVVYDKDGVVLPGQTIQLTGIAQNVVSPLYQFIVDNNTTQQGASNTYNLTTLPTANGVINALVNVADTSDAGTILATDTITLVGVKEGSTGSNGNDGNDGNDGDNGEDAYTVVLTNEAHTLHTTNTGTVTYTGSGTTVRVFKGATELAGFSGTPMAGQYNVTVDFDTNITAGSISHGTPTTIGDHNSMTSDTAEISYLINIEGIVTLQKIQSFAKSIQGDNGADGTGVRIVGSVANSGALDPSYTGDIGDMYIAQDTGDGWVWNGATWDNVGQIQGPVGPPGEQGTPGAAGNDGVSNYFHIAYADDATGTNLSQDPTGKEYLGTYVDDNPVDSSNPNDYDWVLIKGADGENGESGIPGNDGDNGETSYLHLAYSNSANGSVDFHLSDPVGRAYLGQYVDFTLADSTDYTDYTWSLTKGEKGDKGDQGLTGLQGAEGAPGPKGDTGAVGNDGQSTYFHIAYADDINGNGFSQIPTGKEYMGTYVDFNPIDSNTPGDYTWVLIKGTDGENGIAGDNGEDGATSYLHLAYSNSVDGTIDFDLVDPTGRAYLGQYVDFTLADSTNPALYTWSLIKGVDGEQGLQGLTGDTGAQGPVGDSGLTSYFHVAYADDVNGNGFSQNPSGKDYIGTYVDFTAADSSTPGDYQWALIKGADGENGDQGIPGENGNDGETSYLHLAYSNSSNGTVDFSVSNPTGRDYLGQYTDFNISDSTNPADYTWQLTKGEQGAQGEQGIPGSVGDTGLQGEQGIPGDKGDDGLTAYFHIAYADNATGTGFSQNPAGKDWMGTYTDFNPTDSANYQDYNWSLIKGADGSPGVKGDQGIPGEDGDNGITYYLHIAYANNSTGTVGFSTTDSNNKLYIGQVVDTTLADPTNPAVYSWSKIKGETGATGAQGIQGERGIQGIDGEPGSNGTDAISTALLFVYKRSASQPSNPTGGSFSFTTTTITPPSGWSVGIPTGTDPVYITRSIASIVGQTGVDSNISWSTPEKAFQNGATGAQGEQGEQGNTGATGQAGSAGYSYFEGIIFKRASSAPSTPSGGSFNFGSNTLTAPSGWSTSIPAGSDPVYSTNGTFSIQGSTGTDTSVVWKTPQVLAQNGEAGLTGKSVYQYSVYKRSTSKPPTPTGGSYNFTTNLGSAPSGWSNNIPTGTSPIYISSTVASITGPTGTDSSLSWSGTVLMAESGQDGETGATGPAGPQGDTGPTGATGSTGPRGLQGIQGVKGDQGVQGATGSDGSTSYFHVAYADTSTGGGFSQNPTNKEYIGTYVDFNPTDSSSASAYTWQLVKGSQGATGATGAQGADGDQGIPGENGDNGQTSYLHIAYADTASGGGFNQSPTNKEYIGTYVDFVATDSSDPNKYSWALIKGATGATGATGSTGPQGPQGNTGATGAAGATGRRTATGLVYHLVDRATSPSTPSASNFNLNTGGFTGLTSNWSTIGATATGGETYWYSYYTVVESASGSNVGVPSFSSPAKYIGFTDLVTFTNLSTSGQTTINGGNIVTNTLSGNTIQGGTITGTSINLGSGSFQVDSNGNATMSSATITDGTITGGSIGIGWNSTFNVYNFSVNSSGYMQSYGGVRLGDGSDLDLSTNSNINLGVSSDISGYGLTIRASGTISCAGLSATSITSTGDIIAYYSDDRLKTKLGNIDAPLERLSKLSGFRYTENEVAKSFGFDNNEVQVGVSAQQVQEVLPEAVKPAPFNNDYLTVQYEKVVPLLVEGINELNTRVEYLLSRIEELENK